MLQQIPGISPTGQFTTLGPLIVFVALAMAREAYDDRQRHKQDARENNSIAHVWRGRVRTRSTFKHTHTHTHIAP
jgi:phospholipid-translocating ATPase